MKHHKVSDDEYIHAHEFISQSSLLRYKTSPLYKKEYKYKPPTPAMICSSAGHSYLLDPHKFEQRYWVMNPENKPEPDKTFNLGINREWRENESVGRDVITMDEFNEIRVMKRNLYRDFFARALLVNGQAEQGFFVEGYNGLKAKIKPDYFKDNSIIDLKLVIDASKDKFIRDIGTYNWHIEAAYFHDILEAIDGKSRTFYFIAIEKNHPYDHAIYKPSAQMMSVGTYEYELLMEQHKYCLETGDYQGYRVFADNKFGVQEIDLPMWKIKELKYYNEFTINKVGKIDKKEIKK